MRPSEHVAWPPLSLLGRSGVAPVFLGPGVGRLLTPPLSSDTTCPQVGVEGNRLRRSSTSSQVSGVALGSCQRTSPCSRILFEPRRHLVSKISTGTLTISVSDGREDEALAPGVRALRSCENLAWTKQWLRRGRHFKQGDDRTNGVLGGRGERSRSGRKAKSCKTLSNSFLYIRLSSSTILPCVWKTCTQWGPATIGNALALFRVCSTVRATASRTAG